MRQEVTMSAGVEGQYTTGRHEAILEAIRAAGADPEKFDAAILERMEEFHSLGRVATVALAEKAAITAADAVLDVGCGIGGPARYLAGTFGASVTGIDLTAEFCDIARDLNRRTGFGDRIDIRQADALDLPFPDASFDVVWTQHVAMNIADKPALYRELRRVARPGGRLAFFDIVGGSGEPLQFPVPWADTPDLSHLIPVDEVHAAVTAAGFHIDSWEDLTEAAAEFFAKLAGGPPPNASPLGLALFVPDFPAKAANVGRNIAEGRIRMIRCIASAV
jgi:ubiquinone/menaquinone biosynthesis C-methylase UbiE